MLDVVKPRRYIFGQYILSAQHQQSWDHSSDKRVVSIAYPLNFVDQDNRCDRILGRCDIDSYACKVLALGLECKEQWHPTPS